MHTKIAIALTALSATTPISDAHAQPRPAADVVTCRGAFAQDTSHARLVKAFGRENVHLGTVQGGEREKLRGSVVFADDSRRRLEFVWEDSGGKRLSFIRVGMASSWRAANGIGIGTSLSKVERINGTPFRLAGFGWDYGGHVVGWRGGALSRPLAGGCRLDITFYPYEKAPDAVIEKISGEESFRSDNANMIASGATVGSLILLFSK